MCKGEAGVHFHPVFTLPACTTLASLSPPLGLSFFSYGGEGGGLDGIGFWLGYGTGPSNGESLGRDLKRDKSFP